MRPLLFFFLCSSAVGFVGCSLTGYGARGVSHVEPVLHHISRGDTLHSIAKKYSVSIGQIQRLNGIRSPKEVHIGEELLIGFQVSSGAIEEDSGTVEKLSDKSAQLLWPVSGGGRLVSRFGPRSGSFHDGVDIAASSGTAVLAASNGQVVYSGNGLSGYGNLLIVKSAKGITTVYAHNRRLLKQLGETVRRGEKIAEVGATGRASGPHLHFEVRARDAKGRLVAVDPLPLLRSSLAGTRPRFRVNESLTAIIDRFRGRK